MNNHDLNHTKERFVNKKIAQRGLKIIQGGTQRENQGETQGRFKISKRGIS